MSTANTNTAKQLKALERFRQFIEKQIAEVQASIDAETAETEVSNTKLWMPVVGQTYWVVCVQEEDPVAQMIFDDSTELWRLHALGFLFRTEAEARNTYNALLVRTAIQRNPYRVTDTRTLLTSTNLFGIYWLGNHAEVRSVHSTKIVPLASSVFANAAVAESVIAYFGNESLKNLAAYCSA